MISYGEFLVLRRRVTPEAVLGLLKHRRLCRPHVGELAVAHGWMSWAQVLTVVCAAEQKGRLFGEMAVEMGMLVPDQVETLLTAQAAATPSLDDCMLDMGLMDEDQLQEERASFERDCRRPIQQ